MTEETNFWRPATGAGDVTGGGVTVVSGPGEYYWTHRTNLIHFQKYTPMSDLINFVERSRIKRFYEPAERYNIFENAFILRKPAPFNKNRRFPEDYWVNLTVGPLAEAFDRLMASLDIPSPQLLSQMSAEDCHTWKKKFDIAMSDIRRFSYRTDLDKLADIGIYNRFSFEQRFNMEWRE